MELKTPLFKKPYIELENEQEKELFKLDKDKEIKRLKEEYMILQNASDEVEEEKDREIERLQDLCNKYEEEHKTTFEEWKKAINIINELEKWLDKKEKLTFNSWNKGIHEVQRKLQELKGSDKE